MRFENRRVLVTGAAAGIGLATATAFLEEGARVNFADLRREALQRAERTLRVPLEMIHFQELDVREAESVETCVQEMVERWGGVDILVNNAGIYPNTLIVDISEEEWDGVLDTNLKGAFLSCRAVARDMIRRGAGGKIVNITSGAQDSTRVGSGHYATSKAGLMMLTRTLALELAEYRVNVNAVAPGFTTVEGEVSSLTDEYREAIIRTIPWRRAAQPKEIAAAVLFLASDETEFVTGTSLKIDGGRSAGHFTLPRSQAH